MRSFMATRSQWEGTATALLAALGKAGEPATKSKDWPASAGGLSNRLRRVATFLRHNGIEIARNREGRRRNRMIKITKPENPAMRPSGSSAPPADIENRQPAANPAQTEAMQADANTIRADDDTPANVGSKPLEICPADDADARDAESPPISAGWRVDL